MKYFKSKSAGQIIWDTLFVIFLLSLLYKLLHVFRHYGYETWNISEFLINYSGGFVRRGLTGEILYFFAHNFNIDVEWMIKAVCFVALIVVCTFFIKSFLKKGYSLYILPMCFFLGGDILFEHFWIRKDYLFFCFFIPALWLYAKTNLSMPVRMLFINILFVFIILSHEVFAFFALPIFFLMLFNRFKAQGILRSSVLSFLCLLPGILAFMSTVFCHGDEQTVQSIRDSWTGILNIEAQKGCPSVDAIGWSVIPTFIRQLTINFVLPDNGIIPLPVWIITFTVIYYIATNALLTFRKNESVFTTRHKTALSSILVFQLFCLSPVLTILSCDYIRIIFYWIASSFAIFLLIPLKEIETVLPAVLIRNTERINSWLSEILKPTKTSLVFLMLFTAVSGCCFMINWAYKTTMIYNILYIISKPFIILKSLL